MFLKGVAEVPPRNAKPATTKRVWALLSHAAGSYLLLDVSGASITGWHTAQGLFLADSLPGASGMSGTAPVWGANRFCPCAVLLLQLLFLQRRGLQKISTSQLWEKMHPEQPQQRMVRKWKLSQLTILEEGPVGSVCSGLTMPDSMMASLVAGGHTSYSSIATPPGFCLTTGGGGG